MAEGDFDPGAYASGGQTTTVEPPPTTQEFDPKAYAKGGEFNAQEYARGGAPDFKPGKTTFYYPATPEDTASAGLSYKMEGGIHGSGEFSGLDLRNHTLEKYKNGDSPFVAVAMNGIPLGTEFNTQIHGTPALVRVVDRGGGLVPGQMDVATANPDLARGYKLTGGGQIPQIPLAVPTKELEETAQLPGEEEPQEQTPAAPHVGALGGFGVPDFKVPGMPQVPIESGPPGFWQGVGSGLGETIKGVVPHTAQGVRQGATILGAPSAPGQFFGQAGQAALADLKVIGDAIKSGSPFSYESGRALGIMGPQVAMLLTGQRVGPLPEEPLPAVPPPVQVPVQQVTLSKFANRFTAQRVNMGELGEVRPGIGVATKDLIDRGAQMGPEEINQHVSDVMQGGNAAIDQAAAIRAEEARLSAVSSRASKIAEANPKDVEAQIAADNAFKDLTDFHNGPVAKLKNNWHQQGVLMQGEHPIDLTTLNGQREAWLKSVGEPPPPEATKALAKNARYMKEAGDNLAKIKRQWREAAKARNPGITPEMAREQLLVKLKKLTPCK